MYKQGFIEYFKDFWNYVDQMHIWFGYASVFLQLKTYNVYSGTHSHTGDILLILITYLMLVKTFFYLRIFSSISYIYNDENCVLWPKSFPVLLPSSHIDVFCCVWNSQSRPVSTFLRPKHKEDEEKSKRLPISRISIPILLFQQYHWNHQNIPRRFWIWSGNVAFSKIQRYLLDCLVLYHNDVMCCVP